MSSWARSVVVYSGIRVVARVLGIQRCLTMRVMMHLQCLLDLLCARGRPQLSAYDMLFVHLKFNFHRTCSRTERDVFCTLSHFCTAPTS